VSHAHILVHITYCYCYSWSTTELGRIVLGLPHIGRMYFTRVFHALRRYAISTTAEQDLMRDPYPSAGIHIHIQQSRNTRTESRDATSFRSFKSIALRNRIASHTCGVNISDLRFAHVSSHTASASSGLKLQTFSAVRCATFQNSQSGAAFLARCSFPRSRFSLASAIRLMKHTVYVAVLLLHHYQVYCMNANDAPIYQLKKSTTRVTKFSVE
jgi:hypothetical protein